MQNAVHFALVPSRLILVGKKFEVVQCSLMRITLMGLNGILGSHQVKPMPISAVFII